MFKGFADKFLLTTFHQTFIINLLYLTKIK